MAITAILPNISHENMAVVSAVLICESRFNTRITDRIQLIPWQMKVAHATPAIPIEKTFTKRMSTRILAVEEKARNINGVFESPSAENIPVDIL